MRDPTQAPTCTPHEFRNLKSVGTLGTVGTVSNGEGFSRSHHKERSGDGWEHNSSCEHKSGGSYSRTPDLFPLENGVGTCSPSETRMVIGCSHVLTVPMVCERGMCVAVDEKGSCT